MRSLVTGGFVYRKYVWYINIRIIATLSLISGTGGRSWRTLLVSKDYKKRDNLKVINSKELSLDRVSAAWTK